MAATLAGLCRDARVLVRRGGEPDLEGACVVYWMQRAQRGRDNDALDVAIEAANLLGKPLVVFFRLALVPAATWRAYDFMLQGLAELEEELRGRGARFVLRGEPEASVAGFAEEVRASLVVGDENPLRTFRAWREQAAAELRVPFWTVDADVIVPTRLLGKEQFAARTMRPRIGKLLPEYLRRHREPVARAVWPRGRPRPRSLVVGAELLDRLAIDRSVAPVAAWRGGRREGLRHLRAFVRHGLAGYDVNRNHPERPGTSRLSPYLHFGQLGPREVALAVRAAAAPAEDKQAFLEQLIVRRELAVNFVHYNEAYDGLAGCEPWARRTLQAHAGDSRQTLPRATLEAAETPDPLWNAAQRQMLLSGWMHNYVRMYWAKRLLEWCPTPEEAFATAVSLNDRYELDGRDPNGYAGIAWSIGGKHDRAWGPERSIFGLVRYMSPAAMPRKFDARAYIAQVNRLEGE